MSFINTIYNLLPVSIQNLGISLWGIKWNKRRFGGIYTSELNACKLREKYTLNEWNEYQTIQLRKILLHSFNHVPYYKELFNNLDISEDDIKKFNLHDLQKITILQKSILREKGTSELLSNKLESNGEFYASSGSTGTPTQILFSAAMHQRWSALFEARIRNWAGLSINNPRGMIGGRRIINSPHAKPPYYRINKIEKQVYFSAYHIAPHAVSNYIKGMFDNHIDYMTGYAMSNYILARFIENLHLKAPKLKAVITSSEKLTKEMRETFQRVYGCKSFDSYSGLEACGLISECEHASLHISPDAGIIEIIKDDNTPAQPGETGEAICTGFLNFDQPLIRYQIGDLLKLSHNQTCKCGRNMPIIEEIVGRSEDTVVGKDGREMVRFHGIFIQIPSIIEGQIIQNSLTQFEINIVSASPLTLQEKELMKNRMTSQLGEIELTIHEIPSIPRNQNGKFKAVISHVKK